MFDEPYSDAPIFLVFSTSNSFGVADHLIGVAIDVANGNGSWISAVSAIVEDKAAFASETWSFTTTARPGSGASANLDAAPQL